jgi:ABC-type antimicrobial peptide transport system permease subunit
MRELGLRAAMGASAARLLGAVLRRATIMAATGLLGGLMIAWLLAPRLGDLVFRVSPRDPLSLGVVGLILLATAVLAALRPARLASRADPVLLIRAE